MKARYNNLKNGLSTKINIKKNLLQIRSPLLKKIDQTTHNINQFNRIDQQQKEHRKVISKPSLLNLQKLMIGSEISSPITVRSPTKAGSKFENSACLELSGKRGRIVHAVIKCKDLTCSAQIENVGRYKDKDDKSIKSPIKIQTNCTIYIDQQQPMNRRRRVTEGAPRNQSQIKQPQSCIKRRVSISQKCLPKSDLLKKINYQKYISLLSPSIYSKHRMKLPQQQKSFLLDKLIGAGSQSQVYLAHSIPQQSLSLSSSQPSYGSYCSKYVIKIYDKNKFWSKSKKQRIHSQIRILSTMEPHNNVISLIQAYQNKTHIHLIFQHVWNAETLTKYFQKRQFKVQQKQVARIFYKIIRGLAHLHGQGIAHRDIKPDNIIIGSDQDGGMAVKIIDFGLAIDQFSLNTRQYCGTKNYLAPQIIIPVLTPSALTPQKLQSSDIWALGVMLHYLTAGTYPFKGMNQNQLYKNIKQGKYQTNQHKQSQKLKKLIRKMLEVEVEKRVNAKELVNDRWFYEGL